MTTRATTGAALRVPLCPELGPACATSRGVGYSRYQSTDSQGNRGV